MVQEAISHKVQISPETILIEGLTAIGEKQGIASYPASEAEGCRFEPRRGY